jgi:hypothetical protein
MPLTSSLVRLSDNKPAEPRATIACPTPPCPWPAAQQQGPLRCMAAAALALGLPPHPARILTYCKHADHTPAAWAQHPGPDLPDQFLHHLETTGIQGPHHTHVHAARMLQCMCLAAPCLLPAQACSALPCPCFSLADNCNYQLGEGRGGRSLSCPLGASLCHHGCNLLHSSRW